jgi:hypothetical protein
MVVKGPEAAATGPDTYFLIFPNTLIAPVPVPSLRICHLLIQPWVFFSHPICMLNPTWFFEMVDDAQIWRKRWKVIGWA